MAVDLAAERGRRIRDLMARDRWSREQLVAHQRVALGDILRHAVARSPYYRDALGSDALGDDVRLEDLPTLSKSTLMAEWDRVVTDPRLQLLEAERHLGGDATELLLGEYRVLATGGSTGRRGILVYGPEEFEICLAGMIRALTTVGVTADTRLASIGSPSPAHLTSHVFAVFRKGRTGSPRLTVTMPLSELVAGLNEYRPEAIATYPTILRLLAEEQLAGRLSIRPRLAITSSEVLADDTRRCADEAWGLPVHNAYASTEAGMMATDSPDLCGLHAWEDTIVLEVVDEANRPVSPGSPGFRVLVTNLWNRVQPLIRYELADSVTLAAGPNPTGRPFTRIDRIDGRSQDIISLPGRDGGNVAVHPIHLRTPFTRISEVRQYQFGVAEDVLSVKLVLSPGAPRDVLDRVRAALASALAGAGAVAPRLSVEPVDEIPRVGSGAKLTLIEASARPAEPALAR